MRRLENAVDIATVNKELVNQGYRELLKEEFPYVRQYLLDPAMGKMQGYLAAANEQHIKKHFVPENLRIDEIKLHIVNPFESVVAREKALAVKNPQMFAKRLESALNKEKIFHQLEKHINDTFPDLHLHDNPEKHPALSVLLKCAINHMFQNPPVDENNMGDKLKDSVTHSDEWVENLNLEAGVDKDQDIAMAIGILEYLKSHFNPPLRESKGIKV
jgi:hypothetical protein